MAINKQLIEKKLAALKDYLSQVENMDFRQKQLLEDRDIQDLLVFRLQQAVEVCIDIATHIIAGLDIPRKETAKDAFILLGDKKIISRELASQIGKAVDFRNIVVYHYDNGFDFRRLFKDYKDDLNDLRQFAKEIFDFLEKTM